MASVAGLKELTNMLEDCDAAVWLGDMNWQGEMDIPGWCDLWKEISADPGPTFHANQGASCWSDVNYRDYRGTIGFDPHPFDVI